MGAKAALAAGLLALDAAFVALGVELAARGRPAAGIAIAAAALALLATGLQAVSPRFDVAGWSVRHGDPRRPEIALTFDDGPGPDTPAVLDALEAAGTRATFFVLGSAALARPDLVRAIARRGHLVAMHGLSHAKLAFAGPGRVAAEVDGGRAAIRAAGVEPAPYFRAPHGWKGPALARALRARGIALVAWTRGAFDTERPGAAAIAARACRGARGGSILLLHDGCGTPGIDPRRDQTAAAIPEIVRRLRGRGYRLVRLDELAGIGGVAGAPLPPRRGAPA